MFREILRIRNGQDKWMRRENLKVNIGELQLRNPTLLAAGILGQTGANLKRVWEAGTGGVITKSVGTEPREGYPGPNVVQTPCGLINAMGLPNPGIENMVDEIKVARDAGALVLGSIFGDGPEEFRSLASKMGKAEVDAIELNLSCPHAGDLSIIGHDPDLTREIVEVSENLKIPVWVKLPGNTHISNLIKVAKSAEDAGADAIVLANTVPGMAIDAKAELPILGHGIGGLSGPAIKPIVLRLVYEVYEEVEIPIVGVGGVMSGQDVVEYILAGASAVEIGTGVMWEDLGIFEKVCEEVLQYLDGRRIEEVVGSAHRN